MSSFDKIFSLIKDMLSAENGEFKEYLHQYFKKTFKKTGEIDELRESFLDFDDIYQLCITDIDFHCWFSIKKGNIKYFKGKNDSFDIKFKMTRKILQKIILHQIQPSDAYMKGLVKVEGDLSYTIRFRNFMNEFVQYVTFYLQKSKSNN